MPQQTRLRELLTSAQSLCETLELGQAETPLMDRYTAQLAELESAPLIAVLLAMTPESLEQSLKWLYGDVFNEFTVSSREWPQFMEINIAAGDYGIGLRREKQRNFDAQEAFIDALRIELGATRASIANPLALQLNNSKGVAGLKLLIPDTPDAILEKPEVLNAIIAQSNFVIVAAPLHYTLSREDHEVVETLTTNMTGFWPLLTVDELSEEASLPPVGWWEQHTKTAMSMPPKLITRHVEASIPAILTDSQNSDRQLLINRLHAQRLSAGLNAIFTRYQQQAGLLEQQVTKANKQLHSANRSDSREGDQLRQQIDDWLVTAKKDLNSQLQEFNLPNSPVVKGVQAKITDLQFHDLEAEPGHSVHKLTLGADFVSGLRGTLLALTKTELAAAVERCNGQLNTLQQTINEQLKGLGIAAIDRTESIQISELQHDLERRLELTISYRGEMPKRTLMTRLSESRKLIMGLSMTAMVLGGVAKALLNIDLRASLMAIAPAVLVGGFVYTYIQWPKEDAEKLDKELDRIRDTLNNEIRRLTSDIQRFAQQQLSDVLDRANRSLKKEVQTTVLAHHERQRQQEESNRQAQQQRSEQMARELRHWQGIKRELEHLKANAAELERNLAAEIAG